MKEVANTNRVSNDINITNELYIHLARTYRTIPVLVDSERRHWLDANREDSKPDDTDWESPFSDYARLKKTKNGKGSWEVHYDYIADYCVKKYAIVNLGDRCFIYDNGIYRLDDGDIEETIKRGLERCGYGITRPITSIVSDVKKRIKVVNRCSDDPFNRRIDLIPCNNGVYNIQTKQLEPYSPLHGFTYKFPVDYNPVIDTQPMMDYIRSLVSEGDVPLMLQMLSSVVVRDHHKRMYLLYNRSGNNGKSTFLNLIEAMVGPRNVSHLSPQAITEGPFNSAELEGKVANIASDIEDNAINNTAIIKQLTGYDSIYAQKKYGQPFDFVFKGVCIWGCNTPPRIHDDSDAFNRRVVPIEFPNTFEQDQQFYDFLINDTGNREALLKIALDYAPILLEDGPIVTDIDQTKHELKMNSDSVYAFVFERMERDDRYIMVDPNPNEPSEIHDLSINLEYIHHQYIDYCHGMKVKKPLGINAFKKALGDYSGFSISVRHKGPSGDQTAIVKGARLKTKTVDVTNATLDSYAECR